MGMDAALSLFGIDVPAGAAVNLWWDAPAVGLMAAALCLVGAGLAYKASQSRS